LALMSSAAAIPETVASAAAVKVLVKVFMCIDSCKVLAEVQMY
jgi:hypothetical protein